MTLGVVTRGAFPGKATVLLDQHHVLIALGRRGRDGLAQYRILAGRNNDLSTQRMTLNDGVDRLLIVDIIGDDTGDLFIDLRFNRV